MPEVIAIIPARYESSRFPGKPLAIIHGKPMFWHVMHRASLCPLVSRVALATDDQRIFRAAEELGMQVLMTSPDHPSGTDRVLEAARLLGRGPGQRHRQRPGRRTGFKPRDADRAGQAL
jgi:3-deoxy-manno-octulosonate cytidylyltransferase (CMP-KDO synthetase)